LDRVPDVARELVPELQRQLQQAPLTLPSPPIAGERIKERGRSE